jgi:apolipoprotein N-acyltransferase
MYKIKGKLNMITEALPYLVGLVGSLVGVVWAMLNSKIDQQNKNLEQARERIADLYQKLEKQRERTDEHRLTITKELFERTCK